MIYDLQKANVWKRISAFLFDGILLVMVALGVALVLSTITNYDAYLEEYNSYRQEYSEKFNIDLSKDYTDLTDSEEDKALEEQLRKFNDEFGRDPRVRNVYAQMLSRIFFIFTFSTFVAFLLLELMVPLLFKNGQTLGKKIFGIAVMRIDGVRVIPLQMIARSLLGKYAVETMLPLTLFVFLIFGLMGWVSPLVILLLLVLEVWVFFSSGNRSMVHDVFAKTVTVDYASQLIFDTEADLLAYKEKVHQESVAKQSY